MSAFIVVNGKEVVTIKKKLLLIILCLAVVSPTALAFAESEYIEFDGVMYEHIIDHEFMGCRFVKVVKPNITYDPFSPTNLSVEALDSISNGKGQALFDMERAHEINAVFCLAVGQIESSWQYTANTHNYFGITKAGGGFRAWPSLYDGILGFGGYINQSMYHGKDIEGIANIYCPPTASKWANDVRNTMAGYYSELE